MIIDTCCKNINNVFVKRSSKKYEIKKVNKIINKIQFTILNIFVNKRTYTIINNHELIIKINDINFIENIYNTNIYYEIKCGNGIFQTEIIENEKDISLINSIIIPNKKNTIKLKKSSKPFYIKELNIRIKALNEKYSKINVIKN